MRILFISLSCLSDPSSGAAISVRTILQLLAEQGCSVSTFTTACFDKAPAPTPEASLKVNGFRRDAETGLWKNASNGITQIALPVGVTHAANVTADHCKQLETSAKTYIQEWQPDILIGYGASRYEMSLRAFAKEKGIGTVFYLANPNYKSTKSFEHSDLIITDSNATAALYSERLGLEALNVGKFISRPRIQPRPNRDKMITFVNPSLNKGAVFFYRIAEMMNTILPTMRFLVVESRATLEQHHKRLGIPFLSLANVRRVGLQTDMGEVFSRTHTLLMPSLWHESGARTAIEAISLGIPVVASSVGGIPEHLGEGAMQINVPQKYRDNHSLVPPPSVVLPWINALSQLWTDEEYWEERSEAALLQWQNHDPSERVQLLKSQLKSLTGS